MSTDPGTSKPGFYDFLLPRPPHTKPVEQQPTSLKQRHDEEVRWRNVFLTDARFTAYFWAVEKSDGSTLLEYDACDDCHLDLGATRTKPDDDYHPEAHLHRIAEWPGKFAMVERPIARKRLTLNADGVATHEVTTVPELVCAFAATEAFEKFTLHAVPSPFKAHLPTLSVVIEPGMAAIWGHRTVENLSVGGGHIADALLFGRILADGTEEVTQVYATGEKFDHANLGEAHAHDHASLEEPPRV